jgi:NAD(P)-dependent dehydrogenase (short-subunit alcohol dehydrogenase family)
MHGRIVLVTGGASGIGRATCAALAREGAQVLIADKDAQGARAAAAEFGSADPVALDVGDPAAWRDAMGTVSSRFGRLDGLVHCAGVSIVKPFDETTAEDWRAIQAVNLDAVFFGTQAALPLLRASDAASIVIVSSSSGLRGKRNLSAYCASKGGARLLSAALAVELAQESPPIRCNAVFPGTVDTPLVRRAMGILADDPDGAAQVQERVTGIPMGRLGLPQETAAAVLFLLSDDAAYTTGAEIAVDGGRTA